MSKINSLSRVKTTISAVFMSTLLEISSENGTSKEDSDSMTMDGDTTWFNSDRLLFYF